MTPVCPTSLGARPIVRISGPGAGAATPARPIGAVLFDFGDTLVRFSHIDKRALFERAAWRTYRLWARRQRRMPGFRRYYLHQAFAMRWAFCKTTILGRELDALKYMQRACTKLWLEAPREFFDELMWQWYKPIVEAATLEPGAEQVLGHLHAAGCRVGLVSNTFLPAFVMDRHLARLGLLELLPVRVYSSDLRYRKPDHRLFNAALASLGVGPHEAVYVGDTFDQDILGATRAGLRAVWKPVEHPNGQTLPEGATTIQSLPELPRALEQLAVA